MKLTSSKKLSALLSQMGIYSALDVINHLPRRYETFFYSSAKELRHLEHGQRAVILGKIITPVRAVRFGRMSAARFYITSLGMDFAVCAYNRAYLGTSFKEDDMVSISATYDAKRHELSLISIKKGEIDENHRIVPIYSLPADYPNHLFADLVKKSLLSLKGEIYEHIPEIFRRKYRLISREDAYWRCHFPRSKEDVNAGRRVLKYEEALRFTLHNLLIKRQNKALTKGQSVPIDLAKVESFVSSLPYKLTGDQKKACEECIKDMDDRSLMTRLLQGDVGTGKTLVAAVLSYANFTRGCQTAIMAPTESLARQHLDYFSSLLGKTGMNIALLTGSTDRQERKRILSDLKDGTIDLLIGTHALFGEGVIYPNLGLAIIDEQHKFGVNQRARLLGKGEKADLLLMSATPIPRTLSLTLYGDIDVSTLSEFPFKARKVTTKVVPENLSRAVATLKKTLQRGKQAYVIAPRIEGEGNLGAISLFASLDQDLPGKCVLLHGSMDEEEKLAALSEFKSGERPILVATSIVEVGIDVKSADTMLIFGPTHFSLSSLHQLRGRIGRDGSEAYFYMLISAPTEEEKEKLSVLVNSNDGFEIAEADLRLRGPGTISGTKQSGFPEFAFASIATDLRMFECARQDASYILEHEADPQFAYLLQEARKSSQGISLA